MRIGGLASGMDIDQLVNKLMTAERMPLDKMQQDKTMLEWKRDGFREINTKLSELDNLMLDMKLSKTYNPKTISSSMEGAVTATGTPSTSNGSFEMKVSQLASNAINVSTGTLSEGDIDFKGGAATKTLKEQNINLEDFEDGVVFKTYDENGKEQTHKVEIKDDDTLSSLLKRITDEDNNVRAFYDEVTDKVIMETTRTGDYNPTQKSGTDPVIETGGQEITFEDTSFFATVLKMDESNEKGGQNAEFTYNGVHEVESTENSYKLNGITFNFTDTTDGKSAKLTVTNDVDASVEKIMKFVDKYNEVVEMINDVQKEERYRDYPPLTEEQKEEMSEDEIERWEERAKSGILRGETSLTSGLFDMRQSWYSSVETGGEYKSLTQIGISTSSNYLDGGKLIVEEDDLRAALQENPAGVQKLFANSSEGDDRGIINRLEDSLDRTMNTIGERAGKATSTTLESYTLGKRMKDLNTRISDFEDRLTQVETRYWNQFTAMEKAISRMNNQSAQLMSQFGGGTM
ncbi:flagellar hook-associated protein 2 [Oceanobacillus jordanicus]|uniref:Flagellar hook-associated protein 2 n=1 Tax=Oceanobacillus jordanicus TaxID=2867266 RepID=A0AAW5BAT1_9BACI|nr:flagellar hook-associated protein 2 [Oceanobacillus jordanicus]MCG3420569.1 flagellar hook-associated protein 2 [Oceanobacillus jordanicus]